MFKKKWLNVRAMKSFRCTSILCRVLCAHSVIPDGCFSFTTCHLTVLRRSRSVYFEESVSFAICHFQRCCSIHGMSLLMKLLRFRSFTPDDSILCCLRLEIPDEVVSSTACHP